LGLAGGTAFDLFHDHRFGAAVAETLAHHALCDAATLQRQGFGGADALLLFASLFRRFRHSCPTVRAFQSGLLPPRSPESSFRKQSRRRVRARKVSLSGPASRAACITFDRPKAKSNCDEVKAAMTGI